MRYLFMLAVVIPSMVICYSIMQLRETLFAIVSGVLGFQESIVFLLAIYRLRMKSNSKAKKFDLDKYNVSESLDNSKKNESIFEKP